MNEILPLESIRRAPPRAVVLGRQGIPAGHVVSERVERLAEASMVLYETLAEPRGIVAEVSLDQFQGIYEGEGNNELPTPLPEIVEEADGLALFAATVGEAVSCKIEELFQENDPATACMLDGIASDRAETATTLLAQAFLETLLQRGEFDHRARALPYSPGYCGWHITGQKKLFAFLKPERIGISLSESSLMSPIKSVSGVLVAGRPEIHDFENDFEFCLDCANRECRARIASLFRPSPTRR
ncbi:MAG: vitamin B12 dependent-methionine synthase activation domain-containing protein [Longimicrobiales bacterium]